MEMKGKKGSESVSDEISCCGNTRTGSDSRTAGDVSHGIHEDGNYEITILLIDRKCTAGTNLSLALSRNSSNSDCYEHTDFTYSPTTLD